MTITTDGCCYQIIDQHGVVVHVAPTWFDAMRVIRMLAVQTSEQFRS